MWNWQYLENVLLLLDDALPEKKEAVMWVVLWKG